MGIVEFIRYTLIPRHEIMDIDSYNIKGLSLLDMRHVTPDSCGFPEALCEKRLLVLHVSTGGRSLNMIVRIRKLL